MRQCKNLSGMKNKQTLQIKKAHVPEKIFKMLQEYSTLREIYKIFQVPKNKNQVIYIAGEILGWLYISLKQY